jgi:hypothetical protein
MSNNSIHEHFLDPQEMAVRFSNSNSLSMESSYDNEWSRDNINKILQVLPMLPDRESDIVRLYFLFKKKQTDIAKIFFCTQAAISYRLKRALERIRFLIDMPPIQVSDLRNDLSDHLSYQDTEIFVSMFLSTCQSEVASQLQISQGRVRHRYLRHLRTIGIVTLEKTRTWVFTENPTHPLKQNLQKFWENAFSLKDAGEDDFSNATRDFCSMLLGSSVYIDDNELDLILPPSPLIRWANYYKVFLRIRHNFNILHEVRLPKWSDRPYNVIY